VSMTGMIERVELITSVQRRRRRSAEDKAAIVQEAANENLLSRKGVQHRLAKPLAVAA
jgi:hypothetical protein